MTIAAPSFWMQAHIPAGLQGPLVASAKFLLEIALYPVCLPATLEIPD